MTASTDRLADLADELKARLVDDPPSASTDPRWRPAAGGLPEQDGGFVELNRRLRGEHLPEPTTTASELHDRPTSVIVTALGPAMPIGGPASIEGGRPVEHPGGTRGSVDVGLRSDTCRAGAAGIASEPSTVTPPAHPGLTAEQTEKLADTLEALVAFLRRPRQ